MENRTHFLSQTASFLTEQFMIDSSMLISILINYRSTKIESLK